MATITPEIESKFTELLCSHPSLHLVVSDRVGRDGQPTWWVAVERPKAAVFKAFQRAAQGTDEMKKISAQESLVRTCVVYPDKAGLDAILDRYPAAGVVIAAELLALAAGEEENLGKVQ